MNILILVAVVALAAVAGTVLFLRANPRKAKVIDRELDKLKKEL